MGIGYSVLGIRYWVLGIGYWVLGIGYWVARLRNADFRLRIEKAGIRRSAMECREMGIC